MAIRSHFWGVILVTATIVSFHIGAEATTTSASRETSSTSSLGNGSVDPWIGDGFCDLIFNNAKRAYDGGDCCECTCVDSDYYTCGDSVFACVDPKAPCVDDDDVTSVNPPSWFKFFAATSECIRSSIGDGYCDFINNQPDCQYDGGDCCSCTCVDTAGLACGVGGFACVDPEVTCMDDVDATSVNPTLSYARNTKISECIESFLGDGFCDSSNNQPDCQYDGGDCCSCTCVDTNDYACGVKGFACVDPEAPCMAEDMSSASSISSYDFSASTCTRSFIGDGYCDSKNNQPDCQYDGGDCCNCTCKDTADFTCGVKGFACVDPEAPCMDDDTSSASYSFSYDSSTSACTESSIGDGYCDLANNQLDCEYDGGDCCSCTCVDALFSCGSNGYSCKDPEAPCVEGDDDTKDRNDDTDGDRDDDIDDDTADGDDYTTEGDDDTHDDTDNDTDYGDDDKDDESDDDTTDGDDDTTDGDDDATDGDDDTTDYDDGTDYGDDDTTDCDDDRDDDTDDDTTDGDDDTTDAEDDTDGGDDDRDDDTTDHVDNRDDTADEDTDDDTDDGTDDGTDDCTDDGTDDGGDSTKDSDHGTKDDDDNSISASSAKQYLPTLVVCIGTIGMLIFALE